MAHQDNCDLVIHGIQTHEHEPHMSILIPSIAEIVMLSMLSHIIVVDIVIISGISLLAGSHTGPERSHDEGLSSRRASVQHAVLVDAPYAATGSSTYPPQEPRQRPSPHR